MSYDDIVPIEEIPMGSIWMAADGGSYGHYVIGRILGTKDVVVKPFDKGGWCDDGPRDIDWFKLQYRYYRVA
jgi:hypothetical protein